MYPEFWNNNYDYDIILCVYYYIVRFICQNYNLFRWKINRNEYTCAYNTFYYTCQVYCIYLYIHIFMSVIYMTSTAQNTYIYVALNVLSHSHYGYCKPFCRVDDT